MRQGYPPAAPGMRIGLLGGSFDPPHEGHSHITRWGLRQLGLDRIWWMVTPGNPLKPDAPAEMSRRLAACRSVISHPRVLATDIEARLRTRFTADTLAQLRLRYPGVVFVWMMGADNLAGFHRWDRWEQIMQTTPVAVFDRPGPQLGGAFSRTAQRFARRRLPSSLAAALPRKSPPCWTLLTGPLSTRSSSEIRARGDWP